jgi:hypothetical protein
MVHFLVARPAASNCWVQARTPAAASLVASGAEQSDWMAQVIAGSVASFRDVAQLRTGRFSAWIAPGKPALLISARLWRRKAKAAVTRKITLGKSDTVAP